MRFFGLTICYVFMQSAGMVNAHLISCFRYKQISFKNITSSDFLDCK
ncbi:MAG: DNA-3-methyladenine glycosylase I [Ignavibacteria bacterium]|nr:DNA-3-methyladenine glycosylase I [Ignavibacteria bacterium]